MERRDHVHAIRWATQVAVVRGNRETGRYIGRSSRLEKDRDRSSASAALEREIDLDRAWVIEAAHAVKSAEVMVEGAVLLHQDNDVLDILDRPRARLCRDASALAMFAFIVVNVAAPVSPINCKKVRRLLLAITTSGDQDCARFGNSCRTYLRWNFVRLRLRGEDASAGR